MAYRKVIPVLVAKCCTILNRVEFSGSNQRAPSDLTFRVLVSVPPILFKRLDKVALAVHFRLLLILEEVHQCYKFGYKVEQELMEKILHLFVETLEIETIFLVFLTPHNSEGRQE